MEDKSFGNVYSQSDRNRQNCKTQSFPHYTEDSRYKHLKICRRRPPDASLYETQSRRSVRDVLWIDIFQRTETPPLDCRRSCRWSVQISTTSWGWVTWASLTAPAVGPAVLRCWLPQINVVPVWRYYKRLIGVIFKVISFSNLNYNSFKCNKNV